ncbi:MAG: phosphomannomutase/phosphoglucomutase, partial [Candidatus Brocadiales bacterium]
VYDVRGLYPEEVNEDAARRIGSALVHFLKQQRGSIKNIVVGRDMRDSSIPLAQSLIEGITSSGVNVIDIGVVPTDVTYFAVAKYGYDGSVSVTASHNPARYNGFKICRELAVPVGIETGLAQIRDIAMRPPAQGVEHPGKVIEKDIMEDYRAHVHTFVHKLRPMRIVVDAGNGMAGKTVPVIFEGLPCQIIPLYFELDGNFPHHEADPLKLKNLKDLQERVRKEKAHLGVAFDGDADRVAFVDEKGEAIKNDVITALIAREFLGEEKGATVIYDLRSSWVVKEEIERSGGKPYREKVGHAYIKATMRKKNAVFGGELSGHYYFRDNFYADSGLIAMIEILNILGRKKVSMSNLVAPLKKYYSSGEINFTVEDKDAMIDQLASSFSDGKLDRLDGVTVEYRDWWFNVRKSNTEPKLRLNVEAKSRELMDGALKRISGIIEGGK